MCDSQAFGVCSSTIELSGSQRRTAHRVSSVWSSFVNNWTFWSSGESCASCFKGLKFVRRLLDCSVLRGELCPVFQVFKVCSSIIGLFGSQGRAVLRLSSLFIDYWTVRFSGESCASSFKCLKFVRRLLDCSVLRGELRFVFQLFGSICAIIGLFRSQGQNCLCLDVISPV